MEMESNEVKLLSVSEVSKRYSLSKFTIYHLIRSDPTFPAVNIGPKKNYRIQSDLFKIWLDQRLKERHYYDFKVPTADQLYRIGRN
jgi:predicted DNA-binding transcriptional regulator AlpA